VNAKLNKRYIITFSAYF